MPLLPMNMRTFFCFVVIALGCIDAPAKSRRIGNYDFHLSRSGHKVALIIRNAPFESSKHSHGYNENIGPLVDGRKAYGAESIPRTQIKSIVLYFDGRPIKVSRWLYSDCYNPNLESEYVKLRLARNRQTVFVTMDGADGAGAYTVVWVLKRNGRHSRFFKPAF